MSKQANEQTSEQVKENMSVKAEEKEEAEKEVKVMTMKEAEVKAEEEAEREWTNVHFTVRFYSVHKLFCLAHSTLRLISVKETIHSCLLLGNSQALLFNCV